ncbi:hypothetical protein KSP40_PGU010636 [Platanthera guangdongensis]|uniref:Protein SDA1 n=1 Tax=Platanthera guangdongensis TaxID=2320717 RepID=A0ABR2N4R0_9ASPA
MTPATSSYLLSLESFTASGQAAESLSLLMLQLRMKMDPEGHDTELLLVYRHFKSTLQLFKQQSMLSFTSDLAISKYLGDLVMFLTHMIPFYPLDPAEFPNQVSDILRTNAQTLPSSLCCHLSQDTILLVNRKVRYNESYSHFFDALLH